MLAVRISLCQTNLSRDQPRWFERWRQRLGLGMLDISWSRYQNPSYSQRKQIALISWVARGVCWTVVRAIVELVRPAKCRCGAALAWLVCRCEARLARQQPDLRRSCAEAMRHGRSRGSGQIHCTARYRRGLGMQLLCEQRSLRCRGNMEPDHLRNAAAVTKGHAGSKVDGRTKLKLPIKAVNAKHRKAQQPSPCIRPNCPHGGLGFAEGRKVARPRGSHALTISVLGNAPDGRDKCSLRHHASFRHRREPWHRTRARACVDGWEEGPRNSRSETFRATRGANDWLLRASIPKQVAGNRS